MAEPKAGSVKREILMSTVAGETRVAILEDEVLVELMVDRPESARIVGDIYLGKVEAVLPGIQAAFVDIGTDKAAFLHVSDVATEDEDGEDAERPRHARHHGQDVPQRVGLAAGRCRVPAGLGERGGEDVRLVVVLGAGDVAAAAKLLRAVDEAARGLGAKPLLDEVRALARSARVTLGDTEQTPAHASEHERLGLTEREAEVLRLVANGSSNRHIAEVLFISPKTVSVHVSNILAKLGVASRGEAGALAHRLGVVDGTGS
jgi:Ribonuclease G/E